MGAILLIVAVVIGGAAWELTSETAGEYFAMYIMEPTDFGASNREPADFDTNANGGVRVPMFADLKRHDMGPDLAEDFALADAQTNAEYTTAKLWGVVDSGPWLHDGRALTITDAILLHGGEAIEGRDAFAALSDEEKVSVLTFLRTLQTPKPNNAGGNNNPRRRLRPGTAITGSNEIQSLSSHQ